MSRDTPLTAWEPTESGWRWGRYEVTRGGPGEWILTSGGRRMSTHARASDAATEASLVDRSRRRRLAVVRNLVMVVVAMLVLVVAYAQRTVTNDAHGPAVEFAADLEAAYRSVESGDAAVEDFTGAGGIEGGSFVTDVPINLGDTKAATRSYEVLVATHAGACYVVRWTPGGAVLTGVLEPDLPCEPDPRLVDVSLFARAASQPPGTAAFRWGDVLPPPSFQARWFVPVLLAVAFIVAQGLVGLTLALIRQPRRRVPPLSINVNDPRAPITVKRS